MKEIHAPENAGGYLVRCISQYEEMMRDINLNKKKGLETMAGIECCFQIATHYRNILLNELVRYQFQHQAEEIFFFKKIKPLYNAEIEFYGLCNYAEIFKRTEGNKEPPALEPFLIKEKGRLEKFGKENTLFYNYIQEGRTDMDPVWFTRLEDQSTNSQYDGLMGTYLAIEKYVELVGSGSKRMVNGQ